MTDEKKAERPAAPPSVRRERTSPRQFLREVRGELRKVAWPSRREVTSYSLVVLVTVSLIMAFIFGLDQLFGQFVLWIFG
jgi:preprotein translocase subunit SecE